MNDLKGENSKVVEDYIANDLNLLLVAYDKELEYIKFEKMLKLIIFELKKCSDLHINSLERTYKEIITNFTKYRTVNASVYLTAFKEIRKR